LLTHGSGWSNRASGFGQTVVPGKPGRCFIQQNYLLKAGPQGARLADYLTKTYLPALAKVNSGPTLVLEAQLAPNLPHVTVITGYQSVEQAWSVRAKLNADKTLEAATDAWESGPEPPFENTNSALLEAGDYSPDLAPLNPSRRRADFRDAHLPCADVAEPARAALEVWGRRGEDSGQVRRRADSFRVDGDWRRYAESDLDYRV